MMVFSPILPSAFKGTPGNFRLDMLKAMTKSSKTAKKYFESTTKTWKHKPLFQSGVHTAGDSLSAWVATDDEVWQWVDKGTRKHDILALGPKTTKEMTVQTSRGQFKYAEKIPRMAYLSNKMPKTSPGSLYSMPGSKGTLPWRFPEIVHHPGIRPRKFTDTARKIWQPIFETDIENAVAAWAKKTGHAL